MEAVSLLATFHLSRPAITAGDSLFSAAHLAPPVQEPRSCARLIRKPQRSHVPSFLQISDTENDSEGDGVEYKS